MNRICLFVFLAVVAAALSACAGDREGTREEKLFHGFPYNLSTG